MVKSYFRRKNKTTKRTKTHRRRKQQRKSARKGGLKSPAEINPRQFIKEKMKKNVTLKRMIAKTNETPLGRASSSNRTRRVNQRSSVSVIAEEEEE